MREKTIKCLMKVLDYQLKSANEQAKDIRQHYHQTDAKLKEYEELLKKEENKITTEEIKAKIELAKKKQRQYDEIFDPQRYDEVAETIVENQMLIEKVDALIGRRERIREENILTKSINIVEGGDISGIRENQEEMEDDEEMGELSQTLIDNLYMQFKKKEEKKKAVKKPSVTRESLFP